MQTAPSWDVASLLHKLYEPIVCSHTYEYFLLTLPRLDLRNCSHFYRQCEQSVVEWLTEPAALQKLFRGFSVRDVGVIAVAVFGLYGAATNKWEMSSKVEESGAFDAFWDSIAFIANAIVFFYSGVACINFFVRQASISSEALHGAIEFPKSFHLCIQQAHAVCLNLPNVQGRGSSVLSLYV